MKLGQGLLLAAAIAGAALCQKAAASGIIAYDNTGATNQSWQGNLGLDFDVNTPISVTALGAFFGTDPTTLGSGITVAIFDRDTASVVGSSLLITDSGSTKINSDAFINFSTPLVLPAGHYSVVSLLDPNYNQGFLGGPTNPTSVEDNGGGAISFVGSGRYDGNLSLDFPTTIDGGPDNRYDAGTFIYNVVPVPGAVWGGLGLIGGLFVARKLRASIA